MSIDTARCLWCLRPYNRASKPEWTFDTQYRLLGTVHASHAIAWCAANGVRSTHCAPGDPLTAQRQLWFYANQLDRSGFSFEVEMLFIETAARGDQYVQRWLNARPDLDDENLAAWAAAVKELDDRFGADLGEHAVSRMETT